MSQFYRRTIPYYILIITFAIMALQYFVAFAPSTGYDPIYNMATFLQTTAISIGYITIGTAVLLLIMNQTRRVLKKQGKDWYMGVLVLAPVIVMILIGLFTPEGRTNRIYTWFTDNWLSPVYYASMQLDLFYLIFAIYRLWRVKDTGSALMVIMFVLAMLGLSPAVQAYIPGFADIFNWLNNIFGQSVSRAMQICGITGGAALTLRILLNKERAMFGGIV